VNGGFFGQGVFDQGAGPAGSSNVPIGTHTPVKPRAVGARDAATAATVAGAAELVPPSSGRAAPLPPRGPSQPAAQSSAARHGASHSADHDVRCIETFPKVRAIARA
jgi:hypothetical protein